MSLTRETLEHLGRLARLAMDDATRQALARDLERMLVLIDQLRAVDANGVTPLAHPHDATLSLREDQVTAGDRSHDLLALSSESQGGYFIVPKVIE